MSTASTPYPYVSHCWQRLAESSYMGALIASKMQHGGWTTYSGPCGRDQKLIARNSDMRDRLFRTQHLRL